MLKKFWMVYCIKNTGIFLKFDTYEAAEEQAKRSAFDDRSNEYVIMEAVASTKQPIPAIDVIKL